MKKELYIQIPEPCHEDWNKMTPVDKGRYCQSCCKEVVDFSLMTDQEIISFLSKPRGKTCGNFSTDQLNRVIKEPATPAKKRVWAMMLSFLLPLFISNRSKAQMGKPKVTITAENKTEKCKVEVRGDTISTPEPGKVTVQGIVTDTSGNPIIGASILVKGTRNGVAANADGQFKIESNKNSRIVISAVGYDIKEIELTQDTTNLSVVLSQSQIELAGVVVVGYSRSQKRGSYGGAVSVVRCAPQKTIVDTVKNLIQPSSLKVYPNPASKNSFVNIQPANKGDYQLKLSDNQGRLIQQTSFTIFAKKQAYQLELPSTISAGVYYINVIDEKTKKQYTQKLIVQ